ncbi:WYL domain-containing protein [bacterium]|nr:WYL domain-containing protein [bacterium]
MSTIKETTMRCLAMLKMIPRAPVDIDVDTIAEKLSDQGYDVTRRTIQRDLVKLSNPFPIFEEKKEGSRANYWSWSEGSEAFDIPEMTPLAALTFTLVESFLRDVLPRTVLNYLNPHFKRARSLLDKLQSTHFGRWHEKIRILPRGQALKPAALKPEVLETVYKALMQERQFQATYRMKGAEETKSYVIHPLGMVFRNEIIYLVCTLWNYTDVKQMALHRFETAELLDQSRQVPPKFDLDAYIGTGEFSYPVRETSIKLRAVFDPLAAAHLFETPLADDQTLTQTDNGKVELRATVKNTAELQWWLLGFGDRVEVLKPKKLRAEFSARISKLSEMYQAQ